MDFYTKLYQSRGVSQNKIQREEIHLLALASQNKISKRCHKTQSGWTQQSAEMNFFFLYEALRTVK